jgi:hypothetical protein
MNTGTRFARFFIALCLAVGASGAAADDASVRDLQWSELIPKGWDPAAELRKLGPGIASDSPEVLQLMREIWDKAPTNPAIEGIAARLPGYVVPLDSQPAGVKEFLLVPYFGACIHTPPPPANQIVNVRLAAPAKLRAMDVVWVQGTLRAARIDSSMGISGYVMQATDVKPFVPKRENR